MHVGSAIPESIIVPKGTGVITVGVIDLLNHAHPPRRSNCGEYPARSAAATMMNPSASSSRNQFATVLPPLYLYLSEIAKWRNPKRWNCLWSAPCSQGLSRHVPWALEACVIGLGMSPRSYFCMCTLFFTYRAHKHASPD